MFHLTADELLADKSPIDSKLRSSVSLLPYGAEIWNVEIGDPIEQE